MSNKTSQDFSVFIPESGHYLSGVSCLECGDLADVSNNLGGTVASTSVTNPFNNKATEIHRYREFNPSELSLSVPEDISDEIKRMRNEACVVGLQRRFECPQCETIVHHYGWSTISSEVLTNGTSVKSNMALGVPTSTFNAFFKLYQKYDGTGPTTYFRSGYNPLQVIYCDLPNCSPCDSIDTDGCQFLVSLWEDETGDTNFMQSTDGGTNWSSYTFKPLQDIFDYSAMICFQGSLVLGLKTDVGWRAEIIEEARRPDPTTDIDGDVTRIFPEVDEYGGYIVITKFAKSGHVLYALYTNLGTDETTTIWGVDRSLDGGFNWDNILITENEIVDMDAVGSCLVLAKRDSILIDRTNGLRPSSDNSESSFEEINSPTEFDNLKVALAIPDFNKTDCPAIYVVDYNNDIYVTVGEGDNWEISFSNEGVCAEETTPYIDTSIDGYGVWFHRSTPKRGNLLTMKNFGKGLDCDWCIFEYSKQDVCLDCDILQGNVIGVVEIVDNQQTLTFDTDQLPNGQVTVCFTSGVTEQGYLVKTGGATYQLTIFCDTICNYGSVVSVNCEYCTNYPCRDWHNSAFAMCPSDPNKSVVIAGLTCPPENGGIIIKDFDSIGLPTDLIAGCDTANGSICLPNRCE